MKHSLRRSVQGSVHPSTFASQFTQSEAKGRTLVRSVILFNILLNRKILFLKGEKFQTTTKTQKEFIGNWKKSCDRCFTNRYAARQDLS